MKNTILGCSHITFLKERALPNWTNDPNWDYASIVGNNSMPIFHSTFISLAKEYSNRNIYDNIYIFPFRSLAFNTITPWMQQGLSQRNYGHQMNHNVFLTAFNNEEKWHVKKENLKNEEMIKIQNEFYLMWLDWYVANIRNVKFVFWCHFGSECTRQKTFPPHLCHDQLLEKYRDFTVDLNEFKKTYDMEQVFKDGDYHPSDYGYESLRLYLNSISQKRI
jgi:hypothetical protein